MNLNDGNTPTTVEGGFGRENLFGGEEEEKEAALE
jgi:hypothetical protein